MEPLPKWLDLDFVKFLAVTGSEAINRRPGLAGSGLNNRKVFQVPEPFLKR